MSPVEKNENANEQPRNGIEQVREILFGAQLRELERKIARLESRFGGGVEDARKELGRRLSDLEAYVRGEVEALSARLDDERNARVQSHAQQTSETRDTVAQFESRVNRLDEASSRGLRELRRQLLDQSKTLLEEVGRTRDELLSVLDPDRQAEASPAEATSAYEAERLSAH